MWVTDVGKENLVRKLTDGGSLESAPQWSFDSKSIAFVSDRAKEGATAVIYLQPIHKGDATALTPADNEACISAFP